MEILKLFNKETGRHFCNLTNKRFGRWKVIGFDRYESKTQKIYWKVICDCGKKKTVNAGALNSGTSKSCGCLNKEVTARSKLERSRQKLVGKKFGRLVVIDIYNNNQHKGFCAKCKCSCGQECNTVLRSLVHGNTKSCGCLAKEMQSKMGKIQGGKNKKPNTTLRHLFARYKRRSKKHKLLFELTIEEFKILTKKNCYYCGGEPSNFYIANHAIDGYAYNGIDRFDNSLGYTYNNCVPCCKRCNQAKNDMTISEFTNWLERIYKYFIK